MWTMGLGLKKQKMQVVEIHNPYLAARHEWDERYGNLITRARNWRSVALLNGVAAIVGFGGFWWQTARSHVMPYVVAIDSLGRSVASGFASPVSASDEQLKRSFIEEWVEKLRLVTTDGVAQRDAIDRVYAYIANGSSAQAFISEFYRSDPPFHRAETDTVSAQIASVLPTSPHTYEVEWTETTRDLYGNVKQTDRWKGSFMYQINPPTDEAQARKNPLGLYVTSASWSKVL